MKTLAQVIPDIPTSATVAIADKVVELRQKGRDVIDFSAGRAFEKTPDYIIAAAVSALERGHTHQTLAAGTFEFRSACAKKLLRENNIVADPDTEILATAGVKQGLTLALMATISPGDEVIVEDPCFVSYRSLIRLCGGRPVAVPIRPENNFRWTAGELEKHVTGQTKVILFNSPHNPTGTVHTDEDLRIIRDIAIKHDLYVITDEIYERVTWGGRNHICIAGLPDMRERTLTIMGLSKAFTMGGWRIGFAFVPRGIMPAMLTLQQHLLTCACSFVQAGAASAVDGPPRPEVLALWREWESRCTYMTSGLNSISGVRCQMPEGGFYGWLDISKTGYASGALAQKLLEENLVAVVPGSAFGPGGEGYLRITCVKSREDLEEGLRRIQQGLS